MPGFALFVLVLETMEWVSLVYGEDRDRLEGVADRLREVLAVPCRVIECEILEDDFIRPAAGSYDPFRPTDLFPDDPELEPPGH